MSVVLHIFSFVLARHRGEDGSLSQAQLRQTDRSEGVSLETVSNFLVQRSLNIAEGPSGDLQLQQVPLQLTRVAFPFP